MTEAGGLEQADIPRRVECGGGAVVGNPGDSLWWDSVAWLPGIPEGAECSFDVLFEREFQSINLAMASFSYLFFE